MCRFIKINSIDDIWYKEFFLLPNSHTYIFMKQNVKQQKQKQLNFIFALPNKKLLTFTYLF